MGKYRPSGEYRKACKYCEQPMVFKYYCIMQSRTYCSNACRVAYNREFGGVVNQYGTWQPWTPEEDDLLREKYSDTAQPKLLASSMNRKLNDLRKRAKFLGLPRTPEAMREGYALGGQQNKGRPRPDFAKNAFRGEGPDNPFYGKTHSKETREILSEKAKAAGTFAKLAKDPEFQRRRMKGLHARPNKPETIILHILNRMFPGEYRYTGGGGFVVDGLVPDFTNVNGQKKLIEVFGETYHDPECAARPVSYRSTEEGRRKTFAEFGYSLLVIWSKEIYLGGKEARKALRQKIKEFHCA